MNPKSLIPTKQGFAEGLLEAGKLYPKVVCLGADITTSVGMNLFKEAYPERFFSFGIAEQNCIGVAAGMALSGKIPVFSTYAAFAAMRTADQIRISLCYNNVHVVIGGAHAGISVGADGATHQALEDIALLRALPNMTILSPCDANQTKMATIAAIEQKIGPVYIRFGREASANFTDENEKFDIGKAQWLKRGSDITIIATGIMVWEALLAAEELEKQGISCSVMNIHTIKPIDVEAIVEAARSTKLIITCEEHQIHGGLFGAVAEVVARKSPILMDAVAMPDCFGESGKPAELMEKYGLNAKGIISRVRLENPIPSLD